MVHHQRHPTDYRTLEDHLILMVHHLRTLMVHRLIRMVHLHHRHRLTVLHRRLMEHHLGPRRPMAHRLGLRRPMAHLLHPPTERHPAIMDPSAMIMVRDHMISAVVTTVGTLSAAVMAEDPSVAITAEDPSAAITAEDPLVVGTDLLVTITVPLEVDHSMIITDQAVTAEVAAVTAVMTAVTAVVTVTAVVMAVTVEVAVTEAVADRFPILTGRLRDLTARRRHPPDLMDLRRMITDRRVYGKRSWYGSPSGSRSGKRNQS